MSSQEIVDVRRRQPLRLWPGVAVVAVQWLTMFGVPVVAPDQGGIAVIGGLAGGLLVLVWWLFLSRAPWMERLGAVALMAVSIAVAIPLVHESIANGMMGLMPFIYALPLLCLALVAWAAATRRFPTRRRRLSMAAVLLLACSPLFLLRTNGISGDANSDFEWRWTPTAEQRLLANAIDEPVVAAASAPAPPASAAAADKPPEQPSAAAPATATPDAPASETPAAIPEAADGRVAAETNPAESAEPRAAWPGFRGAQRDGAVGGLRIETDWSRTPPVQLWRRPVGPGWSSFAVRGNRIFTQEQRGQEELVSAYDLRTGSPLWRHRDPVRFWESNAGAGPRATPTLGHGRVYTLGATGILNALDANSGSVVWSRNAASDTGRKVPDWGIASSPLVVDDLVVAATAGWLAAYDAATGRPRWFGPKTGWGYSSPHLAILDGVPQIVLVNGTGAIGVNPADGAVLWQHAWSGDSIVQPAVIEGDDLLIGSGSGLADKTGLLRVTVSREPEGWTVKERWTSTGLKPYFNDFVVHEGHAFGFDGSILACVALNDGTRKWKGGRYGHGQLVVLQDQDLLLVLSEEGELALVSATPDRFNELARLPAIEGKTWNHPVVVGDVLLVRNGEDMAAFRLPLQAIGR